MSIIVGLAESVKTHIEGLAFSEAHTVERVYVLDQDMERLSGIAVHVIPGEPEIVPYTRKNNQWDININVAVTKKIGQGLAAADSIMADIQTLIDALFKAKIPVGSSDEYTIARISQPSVYDDTMLKEQSVFQSILTLGFSLTR